MSRTATLAFAVGLVLAFAGPASAMPAPIVNFLAMGNTNSPSIVTDVKPDTSGAVGPRSYVEVVNGGIEVFNKAGGVVSAAKSTNTLWAGYTGTQAGNDCATRNDGGGIVRFDRAADRWLIAQHSVPHFTSDGGPSFECVAVSQTSDPAGAYWLYDFSYPYAVNNDAKIGVWPDGYYATYDMEGATGLFKGVEVCALDRAAMLAGHSASQQCRFMAYPSQPSCPAQQPFVAFAVDPANADAAIAPPKGSPEYLAQFDYSQCGPTYNQLDLWRMHVDWTTPNNTSLTGPIAVTVNNFTPACYVAGLFKLFSCIPQPGSTVKLDTHDDQLMDRLVYRNFGDHESLFADQTVVGGAGAGLRWYELRSPGTTPTVYQQQTYAPSDENWRWMGSIAADQAQDVALGFSLSSSSGAPGVAHPAIGWAGRLGSDPRSTMGQGEAIIDTGSANESAVSPGEGSWGPYSSMTVDPSDDCTFWYANEQYDTAGTSTWNTYIGAFKFPTCARNDFSIAPTPASVGADQGNDATTAVATTSTRGKPETVRLSAWDLPAGATASFNPTSVTTGNSSTLTLTAGPSTPVGTYTVEVGGTAPSALHGTSVSFTVDAGHAVTVTRSTAGSGTVSSSPVGINCGSVCAHSFDAGSSVTLSASADSGSVFMGWSGAGCSGTGGCQMSMDADKAVTASFDGVPSCTDAGGLTTGHNTALDVALPCSDPDNADILSYSIVSGASHGTLGAIGSNGHLTYTPDPGYSGADTFTFKTTDNHGVDSSVATVSLSVQQLGSPHCSDLSVTAAHNAAKAITLACSHPDVDTISYAATSGPAHGTVSAVDGTGHITYTPELGYTGSDSFTYSAIDDLGQASNTATINILVMPNHAPACSNQTLSIAHNRATQFALGCSDLDPRDTLAWTVLTQPGHGRLGRIDASGGLTYTPNAGFGGTDRFTFTAIDSEGARSAAGTITLQVAKVPPCFAISGNKLTRCRALLKRAAALKVCSRINGKAKAKAKRLACISAAQRAYRKAIAGHKAPDVGGASAVGSHRRRELLPLLPFPLRR